MKKKVKYMTSTYILNRLQRAADLSERSTMSKRHGAVLYNGHKVVSTGVNSYSPKLSEVSRHAEVSALCSAKGATRPKGARTRLLWECSGVCSTSQ